MRRKAKGRNSNRQKTKLGFPDLEHVKSLCWSVCDPRNRNAATNIRLMILLPVPIKPHIACRRKGRVASSNLGWGAKSFSQLASKVWQTVYSAAVNVQIRTPRG